MAISVSVNPAVQRLCMVISMFILIAFFSSILIDVGKGKDIALCISNKTIEKTCWDWKLSNYKQTFKCPFTLLFVSLLLFSISLLMFFIVGFTKCICPEVVVISYRSPSCRILTQYYTLTLHLFGTLFALAFIVFVLFYSVHQNSCYLSGDIMRNCTNHRSLCWMLCFTCFGFLGCLFATMFSAFEARKFYVERLDNDMCDQLYQEYLSGSHEYMKTYPS